MAEEVYTITQALDKCMKYCAYQERCQLEVRQKLDTFKLTSDQKEQVIVTLIEQNFLNEQRFAEAFARGKFRMKGWGKIKITLSLKQKDISEYCIKKGLLEIDANEYLECLSKLVAKTYQQKKGLMAHQRKSKTAQYVLGRGFEPHLVWEELNNY